MTTEPGRPLLASHRPASSAVAGSISIPTVAQPSFERRSRIARPRPWPEPVTTTLRVGATALMPAWPRAASSGAASDVLPGRQLHEDDRHVVRCPADDDPDLAAVRQRLRDDGEVGGYPAAANRTTMASTSRTSRFTAISPGSNGARRVAERCLRRELYQFDLRAIGARDDNRLDGRIGDPEQRHGWRPGRASSSNVTRRPRRSRKKATVVARSLAAMTGWKRLSTLPRMRLPRAVRAGRLRYDISETARRNVRRCSSMAAAATPQWTIHAVDTGTSTLDASMLTYTAGAGTTVRIPRVIWVLRGPDDGRRRHQRAARRAALRVHRRGPGRGRPTRSRPTPCTWPASTPGTSSTSS